MYALYIYGHTIAVTSNHFSNWPFSFIFLNDCLFLPLFLNKPIALSLVDVVAIGSGQKL
jgi:hypothetical protein